MEQIIEKYLPVSLEPFAKKIWVTSAKPRLGPPDSREVDIAFSILSGEPGASVQAKMRCSHSDVMAALKRVRDAIRTGKGPRKILSAFPEFVKWQIERSGGTFDPVPFDQSSLGDSPTQEGKSSQSSAAEESLATRGTGLVARLLALSRKKFPRADPKNPHTIDEHRIAVHAAAQEVILPALYEEIGMGIAAGDINSMRLAADVLRLRARGGGLTIAQQINLPGGGSRDSSSQPHGFEQLLRRAKESEHENIYELPAAVSAEDAADSMIEASEEDEEED